jgi:2-dehydropantoate 2-reductase
MRFIVYGAGAVGGVLGASLVQGGHEVLLVARGAHYEAIADGGLRFESPEGAAVLDIPVVSDPGSIRFGTEDVVVLSTKSQDSFPVLEILADLAPPTLPVLCAQNGVTNERHALRFFGEVYGLRVNLPAAHLQPGIVRAHASPVLGIVDIGRYPAGVDRRAEAVAATLTGAGFSSRALPDIMRWKHRKLLMNLGNAIDACCEPSADSQILLHDVVAEGEACFRAAGLDVASEDEDRARRSDMISQGPVPGEPYPGSSSWQTLARGLRRTEVDYLNGEIVLLGRLHGIPTPYNEVLQAAVRRLAADRAGPALLDAGALRKDAPRLRGGREAGALGEEP